MQDVFLQYLCNNILIKYLNNFFGLHMNLWMDRLMHSFLLCFAVSTMNFRQFEFHFAVALFQCCQWMNVY